MGRKAKIQTGDVSSFLAKISEISDYNRLISDYDELYQRMYALYRLTGHTKNDSAKFVNAPINTVNRFESRFFINPVNDDETTQKKSKDTLLVYVYYRELSIANPVVFAEDAESSGGAKKKLSSRAIAALGIDKDAIDGLVSNDPGSLPLPVDLDKYDIDQFHSFFSSILFTLDMAYVYWYARGFDFLKTELVNILLTLKYQIVQYNGHIYWTYDFSNIPEHKSSIPRLSSSDIVDFRGHFTGERIDEEEREYLMKRFGFELHPIEDDSASKKRISPVYREFKEFMENVGYVFASSQPEVKDDGTYYENKHYELLNNHREAFLSEVERESLYGYVQEMGKISPVSSKDLIKKLPDLLERNGASYAKEILGLASESEKIRKINILMHRYGYTYNTVKLNDGTTAAGWTALGRMQRYREVRKAEAAAKTDCGNNGITNKVDSDRLKVDSDRLKVDSDRLKVDSDGLKVDSDGLEYRRMRASAYNSDQVLENKILLDSGVRYSRDVRDILSIKKQEESCIPDNDLGEEKNDANLELRVAHLEQLVADIGQKIALNEQGVGLGNERDEDLEILKKLKKSTESK